MIRRIQMAKVLLVLFFVWGLVVGPSASISPVFAVEGRGGEVIRVAGDVNYPPYEFMDSNGVYRGFNVDMLNAVFLELEMEYELIPMKWEDALQALRTGEVDMIQGMIRTPEREGYYLFSEPLVTNAQAIFVRKDNQFIAGLADLRGRVVTYQQGDVAEEILSWGRGVEALGFADQEGALLEVLSGRADAFVGNRLTAIYYLQKMRRLEELKIVGEPMVVTDYSMAVHPDRPELLAQVNGALKRLKSAGVHERIYRKWFGEQLADYGLTVAQVRRIFFVLFGLLSLAILAALVVRQWNEKLRREVALQTEQIRAQEAAIRQYDKMQTVGNLAAGIAHELRNPLTSIKALTELVPVKRDNDRFVEEFKEIIPSEIARMDQLITDLLDYARPKAPEPCTVDLVSLVENLERLVKPKSEAAGVRLRHRLEAVEVYADPNQLKQILLNLLLNSLDALGSMVEARGAGEADVAGEAAGAEGAAGVDGADGAAGADAQVPARAGVIEITSILRGEEGIVILEVTDNGPGMTEAETARAFEPFVTSKRGGYGLGLPMVEQLVRENRGTLVMQSVPGEGTRVVMTLPAFEERGSLV